ncbi:MAG TPA: glycosyltransferase, partial [Thermoanaerobaculia bacterium]|nr:glycosyltransferase [Thermoanaerobaculia bacterium]
MAGLRLDYVSPLPPVRTGIAEYSVDLLPHLAARPEVAELRVMHLPGQPVDADLQARWGTVPAAETGADGRLPLYQMGNNLHHEAVAEMAMSRPGVLALHDLVLHHQLVERTLSRGVFAPYADALEADHGWIGRAVATTRRWGGFSEAGLFALAAHRTLLRRQRGVLVHSRWAAGVLAEEDPELAVRAIPMGIPLPTDVGPPALAGGAAARSARAAFGLPADRPVLGSFGFQTPIKRTLAAVQALARRQLAGVHLLVVGQVAPQVDLAGEAKRLGVADRVTVTGFVDFERFEQGLAACDLAINLRYPTAGETSASLLRLLAAGRATVVSDFAQFADLPPEIAARVPLGDEEVDALAATLAALLADPRRLVTMGEAAREHVRREHAPERAAAAVAAACTELAELPSPGDRPATPPPPSTLTWRRLAGDLAVRGELLGG